jgi:hypothetical protein
MGVGVLGFEGHGVAVLELLLQLGGGGDAAVRLAHLCVCC